MDTEAKFPSYKDHLNKTFLEEMGYKIWSTKGARFQANHRLVTIDRLSNVSLSFLNAYLIIFGLLSVYQISNDSLISANVVAFGSTAISILLLVFSQIEVSRDYKVRGHMYHECSLKLSELYNEHRAFKTLEDSTLEEKKKFAVEISTKYQAVIGSYSNHDNIDYEKFKNENSEYFKLNWFKVCIFTVKYYIRVQFLYHALIAVPIFICAAYIVMKN